MAPVRTRYVALGLTHIPNYRRNKVYGGNGGGRLGGIDLTPHAIAENSPADTLVGQLESVPPGADFELMDDAGGRFVLVGKSIFTGAVATDYEAAGQHTIVVRATSGNESFDKPIVIDVLNVVEITSVNLAGPRTIQENSTAGTVVGALSSSPSGATFTLINNAGNRFAISGNNLVAGAVATDYEAASSHTVTVRGTRLGETRDQDFTITVTDVDEISDISLSANTINENSPPGTVVGALTSTPVGAVFTMVTTAGSRFAISSGNLVAGAVATDYETATSHEVTIRGTRMGETFDKTFTISVNNLNELTDITLSANSIQENSAAGTVVGALTSTPPGASFTIQDSAGSRFAVSGSNLVAGATATDYEVAATHNVTVRASAGSDTFDKSFTINVTDVDEISDITLSANSLAEGSAQGTAIGTLTSTPSGATFVLTDTAGGRFQLSGAALQAGATVTDYETATQHQVTVRGTRFSETFDKNLIITITDVVEPTDITLSANSIAENSTSGTVVGALTSTPPGATFTLTDTAGSRFAISGNNLVAGTVATNYEGATSHQVTVRATLNGATYDETFTINVTDVDEISDITLSANSIAENATAGTVVGALTSTPTGATWAITNTAGNRFALSGNNVVAGSVATDYESATSHQITIRGTRLGETFDKNFTINVTNVTELSSISLSPSTINEGAGAHTIGTLSSSPAGASFALNDPVKGPAFSIAGTTLNKTAAYDPFPYMPDFPLYSGGQAPLIVRGTRGGETLDQTVYLTINKAANDTILVSHDSQDLSNTSSTGTPPSVNITHSSSNGTGPFSHGWDVYNNDSRIAITGGSTQTATISLNAGTPRPVTVEAYIISSITDSGGQYGWEWSKVTLTWN